MARALEGSQEAYGEIVRRFERPVFSLVVRMVKDRSVAEELAQDVFLKAFRSLGTYDPSRKFSSWLFKIAHNATIDHLRRKRLRTVPLEVPDDDQPGPGALLPDEATPNPHARAEGTHLGAALEEAVGRLRPEYREVVLMRFQEGMAYQEISEAAELPLGTVKTYIFRARKELAEILTELGWAPGG